MTIGDEKFMKLFTRESVMKAEWYKARLVQAKRNEMALLEKQIVELRALK